MVFAVHGTTLAKVGPRLAFVIGCASLMTYLSIVLGVHTYSLTTAPFTIIGLALAIFLGFRNGAAYDRYWEGRKLWGGMVNTTRTFAIQILNVIQSVDDQDADELAGFRRETIDLIIAYVNALRHRLRDSDAKEELTNVLDEATLVNLSHYDNVPVAIADLIGKKLAFANQQGWLDKFHVPMLYANLAEMINVQGGCERIKTTPIPFTYSVLTHRTVMLYCLALPCGLHDTVGILTPVVVAFVAYAFLGLDAVGDEIEQPFGFEDNHLPLSAITRTIEVNLLNLAGANSAQIPNMIQPDNHVLN
ncbi:Bestrophin, RFP-TM, chloride channel [Stieleria magnilauensis]|uniref:Bestrophin, RFP-TM, chloride channel n=2 Tax=Stieleria magnilauensis TaxID=2527963 RepID=A0ABX5XXM0_9BACT|nr:Bestrophin, RFP-TM, chloride channel [Planctomycetes bacterium TBK1r]